MGGANCSSYGCHTSRNHKDIAIFRIPTSIDDFTKKWRVEMLNIVLKDRVIDESLQRQIENNSLHVCELHFKEKDLYYYPTRKQLKEGVLPSRNLPVKSVQRKHATERSTAVLEKRKLFQERQSVEQHLPEQSISTCYKDFNDFFGRIQKLKLKPFWKITLIDEQTIEITKRADDEKFLLPFLQIFVNADLTYRIRCFGWLIPVENLIHSCYQSFKYVTLSDFISILHNYHICSGLDLIEFKESIHLQHHIIPIKFDFPGSVTDLPVNQEEYIRSVKCSLLIEKDIQKCDSCKKLEVKTRSELNWKKNSSVTPAAVNAPIKFTSPDRLKATIQCHRLENALLKKQLEQMTTELNKNSVAVDSGMSSDIIDIFKGIDPSKVPPFMKLFWEEQQKYIHASNSSRIRYHPAVIKFCLSIASKSPAAYNQLRFDQKDGSGVLVLPSQRTLRDYRNHIRPQQGFNPAITDDLSLKTRNFSDSERFVTLLYDEMKVQEDLVWDKNTGQLIGFVDLGDKYVNETMFKNTEKLATHVMVFVVKSVKNPMSYSFANFSTDGITCCQLNTVFWKAVGILELSCHLKVIAAVSDGASCNRKFVKMNKMLDDESDVVYRTKNRFATDDRYIYFFSDAPHLIKTARNCLWKSGSHNSQRFMWNKGMYILWKHVSTLYAEDVECGLKIVPKLTANHVYLNSYSVMNVKLATQVLSESVGKALLTFGPTEAKGTAEFCMKFDSLFDCFNVRNTQEHVRKRKPFLKPYDTQDDPRFAWLDSFLAYLEEWKNSVDERQGEFTPIQRSNMFLSKQTYEGIRMSIYSLKDVVPFLLNNGFEYVLTEKFCQDDVENYFGRQRAIGRRKDNPNVKDTLYADNIIKTQYDVKPIHGNCESQPNTAIDCTPLPKRRKSQ